MPELRRGLYLVDDKPLARVRVGDGIDVVALGSTLWELPRQRAARALAGRIHGRLPGAEVVPYVWHPVTHRSDDPLPTRGARRIGGEPGNFGHLANTAEVKIAWELVAATMEAFGASRAILRTPPSFTPGRASRALLAQFVGARGAEQTELVWEPSGLWEAGERAAVARELEISTLAPASMPPTEDAWLSVGVAGGLALDRLPPALDLAAALAERSAPSTVIFGGPDALASLRRLGRAWEEAVGS